MEKDSPQERQKAIKDLYDSGLSAEDLHAALQDLCQNKDRADRHQKAIEGSLMRNLNPEIEPSPSYAAIVARVQRLRDELASIADECQRDAIHNEDEEEAKKLSSMAYAYEQAADMIDRYFEEFIS
jgi:polyhydroxyalkanoate synthesis regulator phasin